MIQIHPHGHNKNHHPPRVHHITVLMQHDIPQRLSKAVRSRQTDDNKHWQVSIGLVEPSAGSGC